MKFVRIGGRLWSNTIKRYMPSTAHWYTIWEKSCTAPGESGSHSESDYKKLKAVWNQPDILDCIRYHHADALKSASLSKQSPAYVVYIADNIASATDRREKENVEEGGQPFKKHLPLSSIFNLMHENPKDFEIPLEPLSNNYARPIPSGEYALTQQDYQNVANCLLQAIARHPAGAAVDEHNALGFRDMDKQHSFQHQHERICRCLPL